MDTPTASVVAPHLSRYPHPAQWKTSHRLAPTTRGNTSTGTLRTIFSVPWRPELRRQHEDRENDATPVDSRRVFQSALHSLLGAHLWRAAVFLALMRGIEQITAVARVMERRLPEGVDVLSFLMALGSSITLLCNPHYYAGNTYLRPVEERVGGMTLLALFLSLSVLLLVNLALLRVLRVREEAGRSVTGRFCFAVLWLRIAGFAASGFTWTFVGWTNNASLSITGASAPSMLTLVWGGLVVACFLCAVNVADRYAIGIKSGAAAAFCY